jgi:hypothetical protein
MYLHVWTVRTEFWLTTGTEHPMIAVGIVLISAIFLATADIAPARALPQLGIIDIGPGTSGRLPSRIEPKLKRIPTRTVLVPAQQSQTLRGKRPGEWVFTVD